MLQAIFTLCTKSAGFMYYQCRKNTKLTYKITKTSMHEKIFRYRFNWLLKFYIDYWDFGDSRSINRLFSESGQHYILPPLLSPMAWFGFNYIWHIKPAVTWNQLYTVEILGIYCQDCVCRK